MVAGILSDTSPEVMSDTEPLISFTQYQVALIAPLARDVRSALGVLDETHVSPLDFERPEIDTNQYVWGHAQGHNVVIIGLKEGQYITHLSNTSDDPWKLSMPDVTFGLMIGISANQNYNVFNFARTVNFTSQGPGSLKTKFGLIDVGNATKQDNLVQAHTGDLDVDDDDEDEISQSFPIKRSMLADGVFGRSARKLVVIFCLAYLQNEALTAKHFVGRYDLARYCSMFWMYHADFVADDPSMSEALLAVMRGETGAFDSSISHSRPDMMMYEQDRHRNSRVPLYYASFMGLENVIHLLLANGAKFDEEVGSCGTPLEAAVRQGHDGIVRLLLEQGANVNLAKGLHHSCDTALNIAIRREDINLIQLLLDNGANMELYHQPENAYFITTALGNAVRQGSSDIVELLLRNEASINNPGPPHAYGDSLYLASSAAHYRILQLLLAHGNRVGIYDKANSLGRALVEASADGQEDVVQQLLDAGANPNAKGDGGRNALRDAAYMGYEQIVNKLLKAGADMDSTDSLHGSALKAAASLNSFWEGHQSRLTLPRGDLGPRSPKDTRLVVQMLLDAGANVNLQSMGSTALQAAAAHSIEIVRMLLDRGADVNLFGGYYGSALQAAIQKYQIDIVHLLLEKGARMPEQRSSNQPYSSPLQDAIGTGDETLLQLLLDHGFDINSETHYLHGSALHDAADRGHVNMVRKLIELGADVNRHAGYRGWPLHAAVAQNHELVADVLLRAGADPNLHTKELQSALQIACAAGRQSLVKTLLAHGGNPNIGGDIYGGSLALAARAAQEQHIDVVRLLLEHGADVDFSDGIHGTPLHALSNSKGKYYKEIAEILLENGADIDKRGQLSQPLLQTAASRGNIWLVETLLKRGAGQRPAQFSTGTTTVADAALTSASTWGHKRTVEILLDYGAHIRLGSGIHCPLAAAASGGQVEIVEMLLDRTAGIEGHENAFVEAFSMAARSHRIDVVKLFLERKTVDMHGPHGAKILNQVLDVGWMKDMAKMLRKAGARIKRPRDEL
ncbi:hypothetical protein MMC10_005801 [Thelotrema lepadinum]|nr:hypothetical protein [Thelotrema lepadinum]